ncbi:MAG: DoxX family protein [Nitrospirota bacterium]|nr:DoxX family protein [Nitrospirota bacterium]
MLSDHRYSMLVGRILIAAIFLMSGIGKIADPQGTQQYMQAMGMTWATTLFYVGAIVLEVGGGLSLLLGYWTRAGAIALILFMIPTTLMFHTNFADQNQMIHFLKNLAMFGGLFYVAAYGAGPLSMDARLGGPMRQPDLNIGLRQEEQERKRRTSA